MILTADTLRHALSGGHTLTRGHPFEGAGSPIWFIAETCEQVHTFAVRALTHAGELAAVQRDLVGDPLQFGLSSNTPPPRFPRRAVGFDLTLAGPRGRRRPFPRRRMRRASSSPLQPIRRAA